MTSKRPAHGPTAGASDLAIAPHLGRALIPTVAALFFISVFVALGMWQLNRADEKRVLQAEYDRRSLQPPIALGGEPQSADDLQFARVAAKGVYENQYQVLLDNRSHRGVPGFHVITPLRLAGGETRVLVNRGWVAMSADRVPIVDVTPPSGSVSVTGVAVVPHVGFGLGEPSPLVADRPAVWQHLDIARYAAATRHALHPVVILLDAQSGEGFVREWARLDTGIAVHQGYAFQWFMLAAAVLVLYVVLVVRYRLRRKSGKLK